MRTISDAGSRVVDVMTLGWRRLRRRVTMVFQQPNPFPMSVFDNVAYVLREQAARRPKRAAGQCVGGGVAERASLQRVSA